MRPTRSWVLRVNVWVSVVVGLGGLVYLIGSRRRFPQREDPDAVQGLTTAAKTDAAADAEDAK